MGLLMAENQPFDTLRLTLMQEVLPVGLALVERVRAGGPAIQDPWVVPGGPF